MSKRVLLVAVGPSVSPALDSLDDLIDERRILRNADLKPEVSANLAQDKRPELTGKFNLA